MSTTTSAKVSEKKEAQPKTGVKQPWHDPRILGIAALLLLLAAISIGNWVSDDGTSNPNVTAQTPSAGSTSSKLNQKPSRQQFDPRRPTNVKLEPAMVVGDMPAWNSVVYSPSAAVRSHKVSLETPQGTYAIVQEGVADGIATHVVELQQPLVTYASQLITKEQQEVQAKAQAEVAIRTAAGEVRKMIDRLKRINARLLSKKQKDDLMEILFKSEVLLQRRLTIGKLQELLAYLQRVHTEMTAVITNRIVRNDR